LPRHRHQARACDVAIKIIPKAFAQDADRMVRFTSRRRSGREQFDRGIKDRIETLTLPELNIKLRSI
jgi:hypothetical protein